MSEFIGSRISLVSRSDIRYVGTLHEINSESSTVALENVTSFGTEGRKGNPDEEIPASDSVYEYIVFRGSDVKDLKIEEAPKAENIPPHAPNDPAIVDSGVRPPQQHQAPPRQEQQQHGQRGPQGQQGGPPQGQHNQQYPPHFYPPPPGQWGRAGPPGPGFPGGMPPYGAPPGWYPPPGQGFPQHGPPFPYPPYGPYPGPPPPGQQFPQQQQQPGKPAPIGPNANKQQGIVPAGAKAQEPKSLSIPAAQTATSGKTSSPVELSAAKESQSSSTQPTPAQSAASAATKSTPTGPKNGRVMPAVPLQSPAASKAPLNAAKVKTPSVSVNRSSIEDATQAATAAVAAAMAKLPPVGGQQTNGSSAVDNLTRKVNELRTTDPIRAPRQPGADGFSGRGRGRGRGGRQQETRKIEVPDSDYDFEEANAKFNKQDLVKEAITGSPLGENGPEIGEDDAEEEVSVASGYNKKSSFFDDLSSETKDRAEGGGMQRGGREWRGEEQKRNLETFGQGSVDNGGYRGGYRGRGRGRGGMRGRGYGGNGQPERGRGAFRGARDHSSPVA